ncbi:MAG TPA: hypothetical protein VK666_21795 [Chryseolinea sp.]|nr:hypothetical protein [Chryseolinea sp.]
MRLISLLLLTTITHLSFSQSESPKRLIGSFIYLGKTYNYELKSASSENCTFRITTVKQGPEKKAMNTDTTPISKPADVEPKIIQSDTVSKPTEKKEAEGAINKTQEKKDDVKENTNPANKNGDENEKKKEPTEGEPSKLEETKKDSSKESTTINDDKTTDPSEKEKDKEKKAAAEDKEKKAAETDPTDEWIFSELTVDVLQRIIKQQMIDRFHAIKNDTLDDFSIAQAIKIETRFKFLDDEPVTANLILRDDYVSSLLKYNGSPYYSGALSRLIAGHRVESVRVETEDGAIKNIIAHFVAPKIELKNASPRTYVEFKNAFPISISGKFDPEAFANVRLYCLNCWGIKGLDRFIKLSDLLALDITLQNDKEDYSPVNTTIELNPTRTIAELKKEKRSRILEVAAFTDFVGLDQEQPNGLIQFEAKRKLNINTKSRIMASFETEDEITNQMNVSGMTEVSRDLKKDATIHVYKRPLEKGEFLPDSSKNIKVEIKQEPSTKKKDSLVSMVYFTYTIPKQTKFHSSYYTVVNNIEPRLLFSKLEQNQRFIDSLGLDGGKISPVKLLQYQLVSFGFTANIFKLSFPQLKFSWNVMSAGLYWFRSRVGISSDSSRASTPINSSYLLLSTEAVFKPDNRWGVTMGVNFIKPSIWNGTYELANSHPIIQPHFDAFLKTNETDKLFFRFAWSSEYKQRENNFTQIQLGYSVNLFTADSNSKAK